MERDQAVVYGSNSTGIGGPCRFILWLARAERLMPRLRWRGRWNVGGWLLVPTLLSLIGSLWLSATAPIGSLFLLVAAALGTTLFLWITEHVEIRSGTPPVPHR